MRQIRSEELSDECLDCTIKSFDELYPKTSPALEREGWVNSCSRAGMWMLCDKHKDNVLDMT